MLDDKVALVTGAGSGIGHAAVGEFAGAGARVVAIDLDGDAAAAAAESVDGVAVAGDVSDPATWDRALEVAAGLGGVDLAYLNAGLYGWAGPIEDLPLDLYADTVSANIGGVVLGTRAVVPAMRAKGGGAIVATASVAGIIAFPPNPLYTLTKHAVTAFVRAMAPNLAADGISFDAVCPGVVDTPMTEGALDGMDPAEIGFDLIPPARIAATALDLATSDGTGRCVAVLPGRDPIEWNFAGPEELFARTR
jgi:NAD(P)-dependent dehydrogenase (short-subunit alcohol dehydrogenase family)